MISLTSLTLLLFAVTAAAQVTDNYAFALAFLKAAYPETVSRRLVALIEPTFEFSLTRPPRPLTSFGLVVREPAADPTVSAALGPVVFHARFDFYATKQLKLFTIVESEFINSKRQEQLERVLKAHPEWTHGERVTAARAAGAKAGPGDEGKILSEARARLKALAGLLGETRVIFHEFAPGDAWWTIQAETTLAPKVTYQFTFEPFDGRLIGVGRLTD